jgi:two-component system NtrC family response regulator
MLEAHKWPGNVRELQNTLQFSLTKSQGQMIEPLHLSPTLQLGMLEPFTVRRRKSKLQAMDVAEALRKADGNKKKAAGILGVSRSTLYRFFADQKELPMEGS